jgi:hypothetical protein
MKTKDSRFGNENVDIDETLEKFVGRNLFPEQLRKANEMLAKAGLPKGFANNSKLDDQLSSLKKRKGEDFTS